MGTVVAFLAEYPGSATVAEQKAHLDPSDHVVVAGKRGFNKLIDLLANSGVRLGTGDRIRIYDLSSITQSTATLVRTMTQMLRRGVAIEIVSSGLLIEPRGDDKLHTLLDALDAHNSHLHGIKTHPADRRGRKFILAPDQLPDIRSKLEQPGATATSVARELGVARSTLFLFLDRHDRDRQVGRGKKPDGRGREHSGDATRGRKTSLP